nr:MAG TPA: hypothetical protein [Caudoviricetes sp.]
MEDHILNEEIIRPGITRRIIYKVEGAGTTVTQDIVDKIVTAFLDSIVDILSEGNSVKLKGYMTIYPQFYKSKQVQNIADKSMIVIPAQYKAKIKVGTKLNNACKGLMERCESDGNKTRDN